MSQVLLSEDRGSLRLLTLNRPDKRNALTVELLQELHAALGTAVDDDAVRSVALTGAGPGFCAGLDLGEVQALRTDPEKARLSGDILYETLTRIYRSPKPVIAAVNGPAVAGGAGLMSVCDLVIVMTFLIRQVGERRARFLLLTGELVTAEQAVELGLVNEAVPADQLLNRVDYWAEVLAACPPQALAHTKELLLGIQGLAPEQAMQHARQAHTRMRSAAAGKDAISDFLNK